MGRMLKRVPLNFSWPLKKLWKGYRNPYRYKHCAACSLCDQQGLNLETLLWRQTWNCEAFFEANRTLALRGRLASREFDFLKEVNYENRWEEMNNWRTRFTQEELDELMTSEESTYARSRRLDLFGDFLEKNPNPSLEEFSKWLSTAISPLTYERDLRWAMTKIRTKRLGVYGNCELCLGDGHVFRTPEHKRLSEEWETFDPPEGPGYQLWETTSEGSPASPVFETLDELCSWCADNATTFARFTATAEEWKSMLGKDLVYHQQGNAVFV